MERLTLRLLHEERERLLVLLKELYLMPYQEEHREEILKIIKKGTSEEMRTDWGQ